VDDRERPILEALDAAGIAYTLHRHPPVHTVEESVRLRGDIACAHLKNLFLRDKRERMWLLTVREELAVDLKAVRYSLGTSGNPSFGSADRLRRTLGVEPGSVTPLAALFDVDRVVEVVLDAAIRDLPAVGVHPGHNAATVVLGATDLERFLAGTGHPPRWLVL
jgi:Ala-tRNA(Pro) deacylase